MIRNKLYWLGNVAKTKIINDILLRIENSGARKALIFDYGCGAGGDWPSILSENNQLNLIGYDPNQRSIKIAIDRLKGLNAELYTGNDLFNLNFKADFIVSFSVLEHVYDRRGYLYTAKKHLAENGIFYLNYDDGHFRNSRDFDIPALLLSKCREWLRNVIAWSLAKMGRISQFKKRMNRAVIDGLIKESGFEVIDVFYSNLSQFKFLFKTIPEEKREEFTHFWLNVEDELNSRFLNESRRETFGDNANLWQFMVSRTLVLGHQNHQKIVLE